MDKDKIVGSLVNSYTVLIMAEKRKLEDVPETFMLSGTTYQLRELVEIEVAERTIAAINPQ